MLPLDAITEEHYEQIFGGNVKGVIFTESSFVAGVEFFGDGGQAQV